MSQFDATVAIARLNAGDSCKGASRPSPLSVRLTPEERTRLELDAGPMALGAYIKCRLLADAPSRTGRRQMPVRDQHTIAQLLARLGSSGLATHIRDLADAARSGSLDCDDELAAMLASACADIRSIRVMLVTALGLKGSPPAPSSIPPRRAFETVASEGNGQ